jgi:cobalt-zinc-cadmium efflux system outer membrane protein
MLTLVLFFKRGPEMMKASYRNNLFSFTAVLFVAILFPMTGSAETMIWAPAPLGVLIEEGLSNNQSINSLKSQIEALNDLESVAGSLQDPKVGFGLLNLPIDSFSFDQEPMTQKQISISQKFPWFGKLDLKTQRATLTTGQKAMALVSEKLTLSKNIAHGWYDLGFVSKSQEINSRLIQRVQQILRSAESRYATGYGLQQNIFQAQVELSQLSDEKITLQKKRRITEDRLNELLNRESFESIKAPVELDFPDLKIGTDIAVPTLQSIARKYNPVLKTKEIEILKEQTNIDLAHKDYMPDFDIKLAYGQRDRSQAGQNRDDFFSAVLAMNIPVWKNSRQDKNLSAATASHHAAEQSYQYLQESLNHQVDALATEIQDLQESFKLYKDSLLPQAKQWARAAKNAYEVDKVEFDTMIDAQIRLLKFELQAEKYLFDIYKKRADLETVIGKPLDVVTALK